jgi:outer membrane protein assembly factor BamA
MRILETVFILFLNSLLPAAQSEVILEKVTVNGLQFLDQESVINAAGLTIGRPVLDEQVQNAAAFLGNSGFFLRVGFRFQSSEGKMTITFDVQEAGVFRECIYDNFVGFTEQDLIKAVRAELPLFEGRIPEAGVSADRMVSALQSLVSSRGISGTIRYEPIYDLAREELNFLFTIDGRNLVVSEIDFQGLSDFPASEIRFACSPLIQEQYSAHRISRFVDLELKPVFWEKGYLKVEFDSPKGHLTVQEETGSATPVRVSLKVMQGKQYRMAGVEWRGSTRLYPPVLDRMIGLENDEIVNGIRLENGFQEIQREFRKLGLMEMNMSVEPEFFEDESRVHYQVSIEEGPQYRMGLLEFTGFSEMDVQKLADLWRIKPGEIYDSSYLEKFLETELPTVIQSQERLRLEGETKTDPEQHLVHVLIRSK